MKKIISTILASACMFCSMAFASSEESFDEEKIPKIRIEDLEPKKESKLAKSNVYNSQKAFLIGLACAFDIDVKIKFIPDKCEKNYNFKVLSIDGSDFIYSNFTPRQQLTYLVFAFGAMENPIFRQIEITKKEYTIDCIKIKKHIIKPDFINEIGEIILNMIYKKKIIATEKNKLGESVNLTEDQQFKSEMKSLFSEISKPVYGINFKVHNFYLPSISKI